MKLLLLLLYIELTISFLIGRKRTVNFRNLITPTSILIILDITKTSSNNCLLFGKPLSILNPYYKHLKVKMSHYTNEIIIFFINN